jgi:MFS transporter, FSR family, fosmidomycin resistance protein
MQKSVSTDAAGGLTQRPVAAVAFPVLLGLSFAHLLNDMMQSLLPSIYPLIKSAYHLDFAQVGLLTFMFQITACLLQPLVGMYTDKNPLPYSLVAGMGFTLAGLITLGMAASFPLLLLGAALVGTGSAIFHPEATKMARHASGGQHGLAQSLFQVGGQAGSAAGPLLAAFVVVPSGQRSLVWLSALALFAMALLYQVVRVNAGTSSATRARSKISAPATAAGVLSQRDVAIAVGILVVLMFSKSAYGSSFNSFYTFYLIETFKVSVQTSQMMLFVFMAATALGTLVGGPLGDRIGRRRIIWFSILGALPFTLLLPYVNLFWTGVLTVVISLIMASAFGAILVYAMELLPNRIGFIGGLFYGLSFGLGGISAALLGQLADATSITTVYHICAFLPALGLLAWALPEIGGRASRMSGH